MSEIARVHAIHTIVRPNDERNGRKIRHHGKTSTTYPKRTQEGDRSYHPRRGSSTRCSVCPLRVKEEGVSIAPFPAILFDPSTNQRASCGFVSSQSPSDNGLKPRSFPSPPSRGPWRARLSSTVRVQIHPISYEPIQTNVATPSMRRVRRKTSETIGSTHPKKQQEKKRSKRKTNIHRTRRGRRSFLCND